MHTPTFPIILGCDHMGDTISEEKAFTILDAYTEAGGDSIDTARGYGPSEKTLSKWLSDRKRDSLFLASKGGLLDKSTGRCRVSYPELKEDYERSCDTLKTLPDIWYLHRDNPGIPADELIDMANQIAPSGLLGCSNWRAERIEEANSWAEKHHKRAFSDSQIHWALAETDYRRMGDNTIVIMDSTEYAFYEKNGMSVSAWSPQAKGYYSILAEGKALSKKTAGRYDTSENREMLPLIKSLAAKYHTDANAITLAWLMAHPVKVRPVISTGNPEHLKASLDACAVTLTSEEFLKVTERRRNR